MTTAEARRSLPIGKLARILFGYWLFEAVLALVVALPARAIVESAYGAHPEGDLVLFRPGALELMDLVYRFEPSASALPVVLVVAMLIAALVGHLPLAAALASLGRRSAVYSRAVRVFPKMLGTFIVFSALKGAILFGAGSLVFMLSSALTNGQGEVRATYFALTASIPFLALFALLSVFQDYVYAALVRHRGVLDALGLALRALRAHRLASLLHWLARNVASLGVLAAGSMIAAALGGHAGLALIVLLVVHQCVQLTRIFLRVSWLSYVVENERGR